MEGLTLSQTVKAHKSQLPASLRLMCLAPINQNLVTGALFSKLKNVFFDAWRNMLKPFMFSQTIHLPLLSPQPPLCRGKERKRMKMPHTSMKRKCGAKRFKYTGPVEFYGKNL